MKRKLLLLPFAALAMLVAFSACSNEEIMQETNPTDTLGSGHTLTLTASMPEEPETRVGLEQQADKTIALTWEVGDELQLAFVQETTDVKVVSTVIIKEQDITNDGKKAQFDIALPDGLDKGEFNLYGVYGGGELAGTIVSLSSNAGSATSLEDVQTRKDVMLFFEAKDVDVTKPQISATFQHLGSLFSITLKNTGEAILDDLQEALLVGVNNSENVNWAYNATVEAQSYNLATGKFQNIESAGNQISFKAPINSLPAGGETTFWGWYPPLPDKNWPALQLQLKNTNTTFATSTNNKPARVNPTAVGKSFSFYAEVNGADLVFTAPPLGTDEYYVGEMGTLAAVLGDSKSTITRMILKGQINAADFEVMKKHMPVLTYLDLSQVICEDNKIPSNAFGEERNPNKTIKTIILPLNITSIGSEAFKNCWGLTGNLTIPDMVTVIDHTAFYGCRNLTGSLIIPNSVTRIGSNAFGYCSGFDSLIMSQKIETIGWGPFYSCSGLRGTVKFPQSLNKIEGSAFEYCSNIDTFQFLNAEPIPYESNMLPDAIEKLVIVPTKAAVTAYKTKWGANANRHTIKAATDEQTGTFTDSRDDNIYKFVTIGAQVWMAENLKFLPEVVGPATASNTAPYHYVYDYDGTDVTAAKATANYSTYGVLYNWPAAMASSASSEANPSGVQGVCPTGWHLPSYAEWNQLIDYLGGYTVGGYTVAGGKLKETGTAHWQSPNEGATNETGFTALPGGVTYNEDFLNIGRNGYWWSASLKDTENARSLFMFYNNSYLNDHYYFKKNGHSVRCVRD